MGLHEMSQARLRSFLTALIWSVAGVGFGLTFFSGSGPEGFSGDRFRQLAGAFALAIGLWTLYEGAGQVPAGWLWFLAYGSVILAHITSSVAFLILDGRTTGNG